MFLHMPVTQIDFKKSAFVTDTNSNNILASEKFGVP